MGHFGTTWGTLGDLMGTTWDPLEDIILGMLGASSGACLGQFKISAVLHASLMPFLTAFHDFENYRSVGINAQT